jgi:hypothetical protein
MSFRAVGAFMLDAVEQHSHVREVMGLGNVTKSVFERRRNKARVWRYSRMPCDVPLDCPRPASLNLSPQPRPHCLESFSGRPIRAYPGCTPLSNPCCSATRCKSAESVACSSAESAASKS